MHAVSKSAHLTLAHKMDVSASPSLLSNISLPTNETLFKCKFCVESFPSKALKIVHLKGNHATLDCQHCHKKFVFESNLSKHLSAHRGGKLGRKKFSRHLKKHNTKTDTNDSGLTESDIYHFS